MVRKVKYNKAISIKNLIEKVGNDGEDEEELGNTKLFIIYCYL